MKQARRVLENPVFKDRFTVLKANDETGGSYSMGLLEVSPGGGNMSHIHKGFVETFTCIRGVLGVYYKNRKLYLNPGESVSIQPGIPHYFFNDTKETVECQIKFEPGHGGFEKGLAILYGLAADGKTNAKGLPRSLTHLALISTLTDSRPTGVIGLMMPLLKWLSLRARRNGMEQQLLRKYYYI